MTDKEKILDQFASMFDITTDSSNDENGEGEVTADDQTDSFNETFDDLVDGISDAVSLVKDKAIDLGHEPKSVESVISDAVQGEDKTDIDEVNQKITAREEEKITKDNEEIEFDSLPDSFFNKDKGESDGSKTEKIVKDEGVKNEQGDTGSESNEETKVDEETNEIVDGEGIKWLLKSPSSLYDNFYQSKKEFIQQFTMGEPLPFDKWFQELNNCSVDVSSTTFDKDQILRQMDLVQQTRNRVKEIQLRCNRQYHIWKRFLEMLRGCLTRIEYLKPIIKQEGLIHEHMRDLELYFANLDALHRSAYQTENNLQAAFDTLSRKVSICMELKTGDRYQARTPITTVEDEKPAAPPLEGFDSLPDFARAEHKDDNCIGWMEIK